MKLIWRCIKISTFAAVLLTLNGCAQVNTARQWWQVWHNPISTSSTSISSAPRKVSINLTELARHHPAWKLAQQLENYQPKTFALNWTKPQNLEVKTVLLKSTFPAGKSTFADVSFAEPEQILTASSIDDFSQQMTQQEQADWDQWQKDINKNLQDDRQQIGQAMRVDLNDRIEQTQKSIPEIAAPLTPSMEIQSEMINLRLKLLNNIALSQAEKAATQKQLDQLENQWNEQLRRQAQQGAENQQYWRDTVPRQMRQDGEKNIQQVLQTLEQNDQKAIDLTINNQQNLLQQNADANSIFALILPLITEQTSPAKSTFRTPVLSAKSIKPALGSITIPATQNAAPPRSSQPGVQQLKRVALEAAKRAAVQSAATHHWNWVNATTTSVRPDVTAVVLREMQFQQAF